MVTGRYRLDESIGQGGMGRVWRATDHMLDRQVAVKEMRIDGLDPEDTRTRRERTLREARATARIDHPNVVRVYDVVDEGERLWIVMELVAGRSLEQVVIEDGPLGIREAARIGLGLVAALRQVHAGGVLHRDIKPGNVLVERGGHRVVLTDFGIAAIQDAKALTMVGMLVGSPDYMAPERISGRPQGPPSDVWSLGATLCAALGGRSPFSRDTTLATLHAVLYEEPELPAEAGELHDILAALLEKEPAARPGLPEVATALEPIAFPAPPPTPTPPPPPAPEPEPEYLGPPNSEPGGAQHEPFPTPALLDAPLVRAARLPGQQHVPPPPPEAPTTPNGRVGAVDPRRSEPAHDAAPPQRTPTWWHPPVTEEPAPEAPASEQNPAPIPTFTPESNHHAPTPEGVVAPPAEAANASTEVAPERSLEVRSETPSPLPRADVPTEPLLSSPRPRPPDDVLGPAVPSGPRGSRRRRGFAAAGGVVVAGALVWVVIAATGGSPDDKDNSSSSSGSSASASTGRTGGSGSPSPTVEGTSRPPSTLVSAPPGSRKEGGMYAWVPPKGWTRNMVSAVEVHYASPDRKQEILANANEASGDLLEQWQIKERNQTSKGLDYQRVRLENTTFRGAPAVVWEYYVTAKGKYWHARLLGFRSGSTSYEISTWYRPDTEATALPVYEQVKKTFTPL
ncbi:protein kinase [Streptomyces sp. SAS_270]